MKKFLCSLLLVCLATVFVTGCADGDNLPATVKNGEWIEVQSITYQTNTSSPSFYSTCYFDYEQEEIEKTEYDNASEKQKGTSMLSSRLEINRKEQLANLKYLSANPYYYSYGKLFYKIIIKTYKIYYVKVRLLDNNCIEINYNNYNDYRSPSDYNTTIRVLPLSYIITYFND